MVELRGETVLVTGGAGFVGGRLAERLQLEARARVRALVHRWASATWVSRYPVELVAGDVCDPAAVQTAMAGCSRVFHCASGGDDAESYRAVNVDGTRNVLEAARRCGVKRVVHVSSAVVHDLEAPGDIDESSPLRPARHPYTASKIGGEEVVWDFWRRERLPVTVLRPAFVWGPRGSQYTVAPVRAMAEGRFALFDGGRAECPAVYIDNLVDALLLAATRPNAVGEAFLITDGEGRTWRDFFEAYAAMLGRRELPNLSTSAPWVRGAIALFEFATKGMDRLAGNPAPFWRRACRRSLRELNHGLGRLGIVGRRQMALFSREGSISIKKARDVLGFAPRLSLEKAMRETERWLRDQCPGLLPETREPPP